MLSASRLLLATLAIIGLNYPVMAMADEIKSEVQQKEMQENAPRRVHIRGLAASCVACHDASANGSSKIVCLAGINAADFIAKLQEFKSGERAATVMHHHAKGFNSQEITDLAAYFSAQTPRKVVTLPSQKLLANHAN